MNCVARKATVQHQIGHGRKGHPNDIAAANALLREDPKPAICANPNGDQVVAVSGAQRISFVEPECREE